MAVSGTACQVPVVPLIERTIVGVSSFHISKVLKVYDEFPQSLKDTFGRLCPPFARLWLWKKRRSTMSDSSKKMYIAEKILRWCREERAFRSDIFGTTLSYDKMCDLCHNTEQLMIEYEVDVGGCDDPYCCSPCYGAKCFNGCKCKLCRRNLKSSEKVVCDMCDKHFSPYAPRLSKDEVWMKDIYSLHFLRALEIYDSLDPESQDECAEKGPAFFRAWLWGERPERMSDLAEKKRVAEMLIGSFVEKKIRRECSSKNLLLSREERCLGCDNISQLVRQLRPSQEGKRDLWVCVGDCKCRLCSRPLEVGEPRVCERCYRHRLLKHDV